MLNTQREAAVQLIERHRLRVSDIARLARVSMHAARVSDFINDRPLDIGREQEIIRTVAAITSALDAFPGVPIDIAADPEWVWATAEKTVSK